MVERSICPHCSFRNFSVSKSCARCEKPLTGAPAPNARPAPNRAEIASRRTTAPLPANAASTVSPRPPVAARQRPVSMAEGPKTVAPPSAPVQHTFLDADAATRIGLSPPPPTPSRPAAPPVAPAAAAPSPPPVQHIPPPRSSKPLLPSSTGRHAIAAAIDALAALAVAVGWGLFEMLVKGGGWPVEQATFLEALGMWLHLYAHTARRMTVVTAAFALCHTIYGVRTGKSLGRTTTGLLLVGLGTGRPTKGGTWGAALWHTIGGLLSILCLGAGHFWIIVDGRRRTWANLLGRTLVVRNAKRQGGPSR